jgi:hypothetical protein
MGALVASGLGRDFSTLLVGLGFFGWAFLVMPVGFGVVLVLGMGFGAEAALIFVIFEGLGLGRYEEDGRFVVIESDVMMK